MQQIIGQEKMTLRGVLDWIVGKISSSEGLPSFEQAAWESSCVVSPEAI